MVQASGKGMIKSTDLMFQVQPWRVTKMKGGMDRGRNLLHAEDLGTDPALHSSSAHCKKLEQGQSHCWHPSLCSGALLGSLAPRHHPVFLLLCSPGVSGTHAPP